MDNGQTADLLQTKPPSHSSSPAGKTQKVDFLGSNAAAGVCKATQRIDWYSMQHPVAGYSHPGFCRAANEDSFAYYIGRDNQTFFLVVADGIGGNGNGDFASAFLVQELLKFWRSYEKHLPENSDTIMTDLIEAVCRINRMVYDLNVASDVRLPMGATLACLFLIPGLAITIHLGDSRIYLVRGHKLLALTKDHSYINELLKTESLTPEQIAEHPMAHVILRSVGPKADAQPEAHLYERLPGDRFMLCSDGLIIHLDDAAILKRMDGNSSTADAVRSLINATLQKGAKDNVTVLCTFQ